MNAIGNGGELAAMFYLAGVLLSGYFILDLQARAQQYGMAQGIASIVDAKKVEVK